MLRGFKKFTAAVAFLLLIAGCQAMTGETAGQNLDDGSLHLCEDLARRRAAKHPVTCGRGD